MDLGRQKINIVKDAYENDIVVIDNIIFKGKRMIDWDAVEEYLMQYVGCVYNIESTNDPIHFGKDLPDEYAHLQYTSSLRGTNAKAKANAVQALGAILEIATNGEKTINKKDKHAVDAEKGWYRYESRFALPVFSENGCVERYNVFHTYLIIRHDRNGKKYLYDIINIKKETSTPLSCYQVTHTV